MIEQLRKHTNSLGARAGMLLSDLVMSKIGYRSENNDLIYTKIMKKIIQTLIVGRIGKRQAIFAFLP